MIWDYAIGQEYIRIESVINDEVIDLIVELPLHLEYEAETICRKHNARIPRA